jgi:DNA-binding NarL/FixJ family response regulator
MRVIVAEDNFIRDLLVDVLPTYDGIAVSGKARTTQELISLIATDPPDLVTLDLQMPRQPHMLAEYGAGLDAARTIRRDHPNVAICALSAYAEVPWAQEIAALGMKVGYQLKDRVHEMDDLVMTMREIAEGAIRIDTTFVADLFGRQRIDDPVQRLTARELEVLKLIAMGLSNAAIAEELHIQERSVEGHETSIYRTLGLAIPRPAGAKPKVNVRVMAVLALLKSGKPTPRRLP